MKPLVFDSMKEFFNLGDSPADIIMLTRLEAGMVRREYATGEVICRFGDKAEHMYFIESGKVEVLGKDDTPINEMEEGAFFGEYAVLTGGTRMSSVCSKGGTIVYCLGKDDILAGVQNNPAIYGNIIQQLYAQISQKHTKLRSVASKRRGLIRASDNQKKMSVKRIVVTYGIVAAAFILAFFLSRAEVLAPVWYFLPIVFLMSGIILTKRTLESFVLAGLLTMILLYGGGFLSGFYANALSVLSDRAIMEIVLMIALLGAITQLLLSSGAVNALRRLAAARVKSQRGALLTSLLCMIVIFIDDHLSLEITGIALMPTKDETRTPREMSAFVMGMTPGAVNLLMPFSIWGVFLSGIIIVAVGDTGMDIFVRSLVFNFAAIGCIVVVFLAALGKLPLVGALKKARQRVESGGHLWPPHSEDYFHGEKNAPRGSLTDLLLPLLTLPAASIITGSIGAGLLITLALLFVMYAFRRLMTPEEFFDHVVVGIEHVLVPIVLLVLTFMFSGGIKLIGLEAWLADMVPTLVGGQLWLLPAALFTLFTLITVLWGSSWSIFAIGLPIALQIAMAVDGHMPLYVGAICAAGFAGDALSIHQSDNEDTAAVVGCEPTALFMARLPYFACITVVSFVLFMIMGFVFR